MTVPTPENYKEWYADRVSRTEEAMKTRKRITGREVRQENLSATLLYRSGYVLNTATDTLERKG